MGLHGGGIGIRWVWSEVFLVSEEGETLPDFFRITLVCCQGIIFSGCRPRAAEALEHVWRPIFGLKNAPFLLILRYFFCPYHQYELQKDALSQQKIDTFYLQTRPPNML